ncbi:dihydrodipicolinate synthase family protein [Methylovorus glucosotrophus]|uniref:Dihydrodipicolinate synthetase n=1 Tax=Methylovorus glucosotrophus (strain SIP3-4) TaxID=582744 RepID=C6XDF4_METGS|nr:dihydrodipicolinate synthase family protein [Methylovorus glucosotrophus]ACT50579.1 dihydrodipicolinate synthetase [Methylovorus glucosotrophus SIP3-4]
MFTGLSAFPLTPMDEVSIDENAFSQLVSRLAQAQINSIGVLGSTGSYAYLNREERNLVTRLAVESAQGTPVVVGIGALRTKDVLKLAEDAQKAGANGLLLAPVSYQKLTEDEVFAHYQTVSQHSSVPICVYDNPTTTHFEFSDVLHGRIAALPNIASIKIPPLSNHLDEAKERVARLRAHIPHHVTIGISGDHSGATGLIAGCEAWYSVLGGLFPLPILAIVKASQRGDIDEVNRLSTALEPIWAFFRRYGSLRVIATIAELKGLVKTPSLPLPIKSLSGEERQRLTACIADLL